MTLPPLPPLPELTVRGATVRAVSVPMVKPLVTRVIVIERMALLLIDLETEEGITGRSYLFGFSAAGCGYLAPIVRDMAAACAGDPVVPEALYAKGLKAFTLFGHQGLPLYAVAGLDMAYWDALAKAAEKPLATFLGGTMDPIPAYNSNGLGLTNDLPALADEARQLIAEGDFKMAKVRLGRDTLDQDLAAFRAVREAVGDDVLLPVDFNQGLDLDEALRRGRALDGEDVYWIEEAIVYDDLAGSARLKAELSTPIQIGENFHGPKDMSDALARDACTWVMPDLQRIGGISGWLCAAAIAEESGIPMSSHIFPEASAHVMAVTPTAHWLEYSGWADPVMAEPLEIRDGHAVIPDRPGTGLAWNADAVAEFGFEL